MSNTQLSFLEELDQNFVFDLDSFELRSQRSPTSPCQPPTQDKEQSSTRITRKDAAHSQRRAKYIARACQDCQRRKVKCSGEDVCRHCRARKVSCIYVPRTENEGRRKRARVASPTRVRSKHDSGGLGDHNSPGDENTDVSIEEGISQLQEDIKIFTQGGRHSCSSHLIENPSLVNRTKRFAFGSAMPYTADLPLELDDETDTFDNGTGCNNLSLSAQLAALQKLSAHTLGRSISQQAKHDRGRVFSLELPHPSRLEYLLTVYFREMDAYFPFLDQADTGNRIFRALETLGYSEYDVIIDVDVRHHPIMALLCNILVLGECEDPEVTECGTGRPGWKMYNRGRKLLQHCGSSRIVDLDLVRYHTLSSLYMLNSELVQSASHAISTAAQLAMVARLNDRTQWGSCSPDETLARQRLWWTVYILDRRIAQRNGTPYLVRDSEVAVDDFDPGFAAERGDHLSTNSPVLLESSQQIIALTVNANKYMHVLVSLSRLWGYIWDTFYAASARKKGDWREVALTDTRILIIRRELPPELTWETQKVKSYIANGETEPRIRRRLSIFIRINLLRTIIRQNPILSCEGDIEAKHSCAALARHSIYAIAAFVDVCPQIRTSGYFISTALVECIFHLVYTLRDSTQSIDRQAAIAAFRKACQLLLDFASKLVTAKRALQALSSAIFSNGDANALFEALARSGRDQNDRIEDTPPGDRPDTIMVQARDANGSRQQPLSTVDFHWESLSTQSQNVSQVSDHVLPQEAQGQYPVRDVLEPSFLLDLQSSYGELDFESTVL